MRKSGGTHESFVRCLSWRRTRRMVLVNQVMVGLSRNGLPASRFQDKRQIWDWKRKTSFSPSRIVTFLPVQKSFVQAGPKCDVFREECNKKGHQLKKKNCAKKLCPEMWQMWCVTFLVTQKSDKCHVTHPNLRREPGEKFGQDWP